ncbi:hypothetical protein [Comamonas sp. GB3 AK4-5]|uniref:hypothetical protein n=1 Tax=Comamonas sp. GB3 AK4-5 TaxID=3231487 RepID=UPI00351DD950
MTESSDVIKFSDVINLSKTHWRQLIIGPLLGLLISLIIISLIKQKYEVSLFLDLPSAQDISEITSEKDILPRFGNSSPADIYKYFSRELMSDETKKIFFEDVYLPSIKTTSSNPSDKSNFIDRDLIDTLKIAIKVRPQYDKVIVARSPTGTFDLSHVLSYNVRIQAPTSALAESWTHDFLNQTEELAKKRFLNDYMAEVNSNLTKAQEDLSYYRFLAQKIRKDREEQLQEALIIAKAVGIQGPQFILTPFQQIDKVTQHVNGSQLYTLGVKALKAELDVLKNRVSDDPFIEGLREKEIELERLQKIKNNTPEFKMHKIDGNINQSIKKIENRNFLILSLGTFVGALVGIFNLILMRNIRRTLFP